MPTAKPHRPSLLVSLFCGACCLAACSPSASSNAPTSPTRTESLSRAELDRIIDGHTLAFMQQQPLLSTSMDVEASRVGGKYNHRLPNYSPEGMHKLQSAMRSAAAELSALDPNGLGAADRLHLETVTTITNYFAGSADFPAGYVDTWGGHLPYIVNQIAGPLIDVPKGMQTQQRVKSLGDANDYLIRLEALGVLADQVLRKVQADQKLGVVLPAALFPKTLEYFDRFLAAPAAKHALVTTFAERLAKISDLPAAQQQELKANAAKKLEQAVFPAYRKVAEFMRAQQTHASDKDGIWGQPGGDAFYAHAIRYLADSELSASAIHKLGLEEVARISDQMHAILKSKGRTQGTVGDRMAALGKDSQFIYEDSDKGRSQLLSDLNAQVKEVMQRAPELFATLPKADVEVRRIPVVSQAGAPGGYYTPPSLDGSRPGVYWINLRDMEANPRFSLKTLTYHEAVPGHHFQIALNMERKDIGLLRQNAPFNGYVEGWALYSELVAKEMGMYVDDPWGDLGRLQAELFRATRLVVDTGLHHKHWTRAEAIKYFHATTGSAMSDIISEVERYMAWPGQALGYKLGMIQLVRLRVMAQEQLEGAFDIRQFHDVILLPGARPLALVQADTEAWIAKTLSEARPTKD